MSLEYCLAIMFLKTAETTDLYASCSKKQIHGIKVPCRHGHKNQHLNQVFIKQIAFHGFTKDEAEKIQYV